MSLDVTALIQAAVEKYAAEQYAAGAASRQTEVDEAQGHCGALASQVQDERARRMTAESDLAALRAEYDAHMATHAAPIRTAFGACPNGGGASGVLSKFGANAAVRMFVPGGLARVTRPETSPRVHVSWKPALGSTITDAQVIDACTGLRDGDIVEVWHESDVKYRKAVKDSGQTYGNDRLAEYLDMKSQFHAKVATLRNSGAIAKVLTCNTWAGWSVDSTSSVNTSNLHAPADLLGIDMDGIPESDTFYPYAARQMAAKFVSAYKAGGYTGWTVPEFCMPSVALDPDRTKRIAWFQSEVAKIRQGLPGQGVPPPLMIAWFDTAGIIGDSERLTAANEIGAWSALVASNA